MAAHPSSFRPKALFFDVFGTTVNWRKTVTQALKDDATATLADPSSSLPSVTRLHASTIDWPSFAQSWRDSYGKFTQSYSRGSGVPFKTIDEHHHDSLVELLAANGLADLWPPEKVQELSRIWHYLEPWTDTVGALSAMNDLGLQTCTLSNGNISLLSDMAAFARLPWTHLFSAELFGAYKPSPEVYKGAVAKLGLKEEECAMVAAHLGDLKAAKSCGLKTIYVEREKEEAWSQEQIHTAKKEGWVDIWVNLGEGEVGKQGFWEVIRRLDGEATEA
ncbi:MAG: hypothetical protein MMC33_003980 [Icmadophila ericetorum]|nr:hypothetical protein [Icmadophila ericetorum]